MHFRMRTSAKTMHILKDLQIKTRLAPNILARLAIGLSLQDLDPIDDLEVDNSGLEFNRHTLTGEHDVVYKALISQHCRRHLNDDEYFPEYIKKHLDRGALKLSNKYEYAGNAEKFLTTLCHSKTSI